MKRITVLGGGTGTYVVLSGLKNYPVDLAAIVSMMDSGGSTGKLRDQLGVLPPGDLRQCLVALSEAPLLWRKLFLYRFEKGDLEGHNFGNVFLSALEKVTSNYQEVMETASFVLKTKGQVIPVTFDHTNLCATYRNGRILKGEDKIDQNSQENSQIEKINLEPRAKVNKNAITRILESDFLVTGPGDLYTSIIPIFLFEEIKEAFRKTKAKLIYVMNLMTKKGQTTNFRASDHIKEIEKYCGKKIDIVIINNGIAPEDILEWYLVHGEKQVELDFNIKEMKRKIIEKDLIDRTEIVKNKADKIFRSILRHDSQKLAEVINNLI